MMAGQGIRSSALGLINEAGPGEVARVASVGGGSAAFAAKVKRHYSYNVYAVRMVEILAAGQTPAEIGGELKATNLAEDFSQQGQLPDGTYIVMHRVGDKNVFYAEP
jgi:hypothetical protein